MKKAQGRFRRKEIRLRSKKAFSVVSVVSVVSIVSVVLTSARSDDNLNLIYGSEKFRLRFFGSENRETGKSKLEPHNSEKLDYVGVAG